MNLQEILREKGTTVYTIGPEATLADVARSLVQHNCGSLVVCNGETMVGIITERDILRATVSESAGLDQLEVHRFMTSDVLTGTPSDKVEQIMGLMTDNRIRHLPILDAGKLAGIISIGDVVKAQHDHLSIENHYLKNYIQG